MKTVFIDSSVLIAACKSRVGASASILIYCRKQIIHGCISQYVISEVKRNISRESDQKIKQRLNMYLQQFHLLVYKEPTLEEISMASIVINLKDAPILAAALKSNATTLITLNTKDFMKPAVRKFVNPLKIVTPRNFIHK